MPSCGSSPRRSPALAGPLVAFAILCALSGYMYWRAQQQKVDSNNVNAEWDDETNAVAPTADEKIAKV